MTMHSKGMRRVRFIIGAGTLALAAGMPSLALAQDADVAAEDNADDAADDAGQAIVVTGTRIQRPEAATATPVVAITAENIVQSGITNVTELLAQNPALFG